MFSSIGIITVFFGFYLRSNKQNDPIGLQLRPTKLTFTQPVEGQRPMVEIHYSNTGPFTIKEKLVGSMTK